MLLVSAGAWFMSTDTRFRSTGSRSRLTGTMLKSTCTRFRLTGLVLARDNATWVSAWTEWQCGGFHYVVRYEWPDLGQGHKCYGLGPFWDNNIG